MHRYKPITRIWEHVASEHYLRRGFKKLKRGLGKSARYGIFLTDLKGYLLTH
jgi:hypothetical protein